MSNGVPPTDKHGDTEQNYSVRALMQHPYVSPSIRPSPDDLVVRGGGSTEFKDCDKTLLGLIASTIIELNDFGGASACSVAEVIFRDHPELEQHRKPEYIEAVAQSLLAADVLSLSKRYTELFTEFNARYFGGQLPSYAVRVVFCLHTVANEPLDAPTVSDGLIRFDERYIFLRWTEFVVMTETLVHEMAHAATSGEHDEKWLAEMKRLQEAGAPVSDYELEPE